ncbi:helix-hairpin-helix domain-containing protein [Micromonospora sp. NPDC049679]|uniref:helix-hairpin-helix domain-containing protein n=1 Tax=Micromonospora sp. NPDC049679 TaxID=3155920 RepID=UPI0033CB7965
MSLSWSAGHTLICVLAVLLGLLLGWLLWGRNPRTTSTGAYRAVDYAPGLAPAGGVTATAPVEPAARAESPADAPVASTPAPADTAGTDEERSSVTSPADDVDAGSRRPEAAPVQKAAPASDVTLVEVPAFGASAVPEATPAAAAVVDSPAPPVDTPSAATPVATEDAPAADVDAGAPAATTGRATPAVVAQAAAVSGSDVPTPGTADGPGTVSGRGDDLRRIAGIGPKIVLALNGAGIRTYAQLAATDETALRAILRSAGLRLAPTVATWPQQARNLADRDGDAGVGSATPLGVEAGGQVSS